MLSRPLKIIACSKCHSFSTTQSTKNCKCKYCGKTLNLRARISARNFGQSEDQYAVRNRFKELTEGKRRI